jgi:hypothetical protein
MGDFSGSFGGVSGPLTLERDGKMKNLDLPLDLRGRGIGTEAVHLVVQGREVRITHGSATISPMKLAHTVSQNAS